ncbi:TolC family outer membrane protein [Methylomonas sp. AM2-LC]|uniref:TolC family outer membrane protein n=1 Tax=Methylomonas sp. AM2-LC TaxID=3153301 RepID=UPI0032637F2D
MSPYQLLICFVLFLLTLTSANAESLLQLWAQVVENNPTLKGSEYAVEEARAQQDQALAKLLPNVSINSYYSFNNYNPNAMATGFQPFGGGKTVDYTGYRGILQISQPIFDLPSYLRLESAKSQSKQSEQQALAQRMQLAYNLVDQYLTVLEANDSLLQLEAELAATQAQLKSMRMMREHELASSTDLYEIEAYAESLNSTQLEAQHQKAIATEKIRKLTGTVMQTADPLTQNEFPEVKRSVDEWVQEALSANPQLLALQYATESAQSMRGSALAGHLPTASISANEIYANTSYNNLQSSSTYNVGSLYLNLNIPIYAGGGIEAGEREAASKFQMSREKIEETRRSIEEDTRTAWLNVVSGHTRIASSKKEAVFREQAKIGKERSYQLGVSTIIDVLDAQKRLLKARTDYFKARYEFIRNLIRLRLNAGSFADLDLESIAPWFGNPIKLEE